MKLHMKVVTAGLLLAASCCVVHAETAPATIPFTLHGDNIVVMASLDSSAPMPFIFDSGLSHGGIVTRQTAAKLGLKPLRDLNVGEASGGAGQMAKLTQVHSMRMGRAVLTDPPFAIIDVASQVVTRPGKAPIAGFIGAPLLQDAVVCIDYAHRVITRWPRAAFDAQGYIAAPAQLSHGLVTVEADVDGLTATLAIDTGNNGGVEFFPAFARAHRLLDRYPDLRPMQGMSGTGQTFNILAGTAKHVQFAPQVVLKQASLLLVAQAFDPTWGIDGLLGYHVLSRLNPCIDRDGGHVYLHGDTQAGRG